MRTTCTGSTRGKLRSGRISRWNGPPMTRLPPWGRSTRAPGDPWPERRDAVDDRRLVLVGAGHQGGAHGGPAGQGHLADRARPRSQVDLAQAARQLGPVGQLAVERRVQLGGPGADAAPDAPGLEVAGRARVQRGGHVGVGALDGADDRPAPVRALDAAAQLVGHVGPQVGVVHVGPHGHPGAVHREHDHGGQRLVAAVGRPGVDPQQVQAGVRPPRRPAGGSVRRSVDVVVAHVRGRATGCGSGPTRRCCPRPARAGRRCSAASTHAGGDAAGEQLGPRGVETRLVGREAVVEVGAEELAGPAVGVGRADVDARGRDVGGARRPRGPPGAARPPSRPAGRTARWPATRCPPAGAAPGPAAASRNPVPVWALRE